MEEATLTFSKGDSFYRCVSHVKVPGVRAHFGPRHKTRETNPSNSPPAYILYHQDVAYLFGCNKVQKYHKNM